MGPNMSSPERRRGLPDSPIKDPPPIDEKHNSQIPSNSSSSKSVNPEESTRLFNRVVDLCETPSPCSNCDPSQVNLLVRLLENGVPSVKLTDLFFAGTLPLNTLIDRPKTNGDLVVSFLPPQDIPSPKEKLINWTRGILREKFPLGITSILSPEQAKDTLDLIQLIHIHSTRKDEPLWKTNSVVFFDCEASWEPDPSRVHCVVYKIQYQNHQIAVLRVDEAAEEHKQHFDSNRINFAKAIIIPLVLALRIFTFKSVETELGAMENRNGAWWLPIVAERARRAREQNAGPSNGYRTLRAPVEDYRVFGSTSQSWLGGYEASTFQPSAYQPHQHESSNAPSSIADTAADTSSTPHNQHNTESTRATRKAAKKKAKKAAQKEAKKVELESSGLRERDQTVSTGPVEEYHPLDQDGVTGGPTHEGGGESSISYNSSKSSTEKISSNPPTIDATADKSQKHASTVSTQQIKEHSSPNQGRTEKALADESNSGLEATGASSKQPAKALNNKVVSTSSSTVEATPDITPKVPQRTGSIPKDPEGKLINLKPERGSGTRGLKPASLLAPKTSPQVLPTQDNSSNTTPLIAPSDITTKSAGENLTESSASLHTSALVKQESISITAPSTKGDSPNFPTPNPSLEITTGSVEEKPAQPSSKKKNNKRNKKGSVKPKNEGQMKDVSMQQAKPTVNVSGSAAENLSTDTMPAVSTSPGESSQAKQADQELPSKDRVEEELKGERPTEKEEDENKPSKPKKQSKRTRKGRNKKGGSSIPDAKSGEETKLTTSDISINSKTQDAISDATPRNESGSTKSTNAMLDGKPSVAPSRLTTSDNSKSMSIQDSKVTASATTTGQTTHQKAIPFRNETDFPPLASQEKGGSNKQTPIVPGKSDQRTNVKSAGMGNQTSVKAPEKSVGEVKHPSKAETVLKAPNTKSVGKTKVSSTVGTRNVHPLAESTTIEAPVAGPSSETRSIRTSTNTSSTNPLAQGRQAKQGFFWQLDSHGFPCAMAGCEKRCNSWDGASVICPKCGPYSEIRYCGKEHLFEDVKYHWLQCGTKTFKHPCKASTIPREQKEGPPLLPSLHDWDTPERFRLAVRHAADKSGDYFVFRDWQDWIAAGRPANTVAVRCSTRVMHTVRFDDPEEKDRFRRLLGIALFNSLQSFELVGYLFRLIRGNALAKGQWSEELDLALRYQFNLEYGFAVGPWLGSRHACETEWTGANHRHCSDAVCRAERVQLLGDRGVGRGFQHLCEYMEASHWLLRAARRTHPSVAAVEGRMRGEGFEGVVPEERRVFRRGEGWDGVGTGDMEVEGVNLF